MLCVYRHDFYAILWAGNNRTGNRVEATYEPLNREIICLYTVKTIVKPCNYEP